MTMEMFALSVGYCVIVLATVSILAGVLYAAAYWVTYAINNSHQRVAETIAGKEWLNVLQDAVAAKEADRD